jgi:hypothetical protein
MANTRELTPVEKANKAFAESRLRLALMEALRGPEVRKFLSHANKEDAARKLALKAYRKAKDTNSGLPSREAFVAYKNGGGTELPIGRIFDKWLKKALKAEKKGGR